MPFPRIYRTAGNNIIQSFSFTDATTKTGYIAFYGGRGISGSAAIPTSYKLSPQTFYSDYPTTSVFTTSGTNSQLFSVNFDSQFKAPQIIRGDAVISVPVGVTMTAGSGTQFTMKVFAELDKISDGAETYLISGAFTPFQGYGLSPSLTDTTQYSQELTQILTIPQTHFKIDDSLRLKITLQGYSNGAAEIRFGIAHDPANRNDFSYHPNTHSATGQKIIADTTNTDLQALIPFRID